MTFEDRSPGESTREFAKKIFKLQKRKTKLHSIYVLRSGFCRPHSQWTPRKESLYEEYIWSSKLGEDERGKEKRMEKHWDKRRRSGWEEEKEKRREEEYETVTVKQMWGLCSVAIWAQEPFPVRACTVFFPFTSFSDFALSRCLQTNFVVFHLFSWHVRMMERMCQYLRYLPPLRIWVPLVVLFLNLMGQEYRATTMEEKINEIYLQLPRSSCKTGPGPKIASRCFPPRRQRLRVLNRLLGASWLALPLWKQVQPLALAAPIPWPWIIWCHLKCKTKTRYILKSRRWTITKCRFTPVPLRTIPQRDYKVDR